MTKTKTKSTKPPKKAVPAKKQSKAKTKAKPTKDTPKPPRKKSKMNDLLGRVLKALKPPENLTVSEWADRYRVLSTENSAEAGKWRTSRTPYLRDIMDAFTDDGVHRIALVSGAQIGKTEMLLNMLGYAICEDPASIMFVQPTLETAEDFSKRRISAMFRDTPAIKERVATGKARAGDNTIYKKTFLGGMLTITGSNSPSSLASIPARYVFGDERDRWAISAGAEGDPFDLLVARTTTFFNRKIVETSTPTIKDASAIEKSFKLGTQERWCSQCPHCGTFHNIIWRDIKFDYEEVKAGDEITHLVKRVEWQCPTCTERFTEIEMRNQPQKWIAENPEALKNGIRSFWLNAFSSPWVRWEYIVLRWLQAKDDPEKLKVVFNTLLGELWEIRANTEGISELLSRREEYEAEVPDGVIVLTCGVDTQDDRLEYEVVGHGYYGETWGIEKGIILGRPDDPAVWQRFDELITREFKFKSGASIRIAITFIDSGGHFTQEIYKQCLIRQPLRVFAIKGKGGQDVPYVTQPSTVAISGTKRKAKLFVLGVDAGKEQIAWSLNIKTTGARYMHFPKDEARGYDSNYFTQLTSEHLVPTRKNGRAALKWDLKEGYTRNEALDCRNYALAAFRALNPDLDAIMRRRKKTNEPRKNIAAVPARPKPQRETFTGFSGGFETMQRGRGSSFADDFNEW